MALQQLPNYIRIHRKRLGLSQNEVAFLLGGRDKSKPSRYEHFSRIPNLRTALALAVIFQVPVSKLFSGEHQKMENAVTLQAQRLVTRIAIEKQNPLRTRKLALLKILASSG